MLAQSGESSAAQLNDLPLDPVPVSNKASRGRTWEQSNTIRTPQKVRVLRRPWKPWPRR